MLEDLEENLLSVMQAIGKQPPELGGLKRWITWRENGKWQKKSKNILPTEGKKINENDKVPFEGNKVIFFPVSPRKGWEIAAENPWVWATLRKWGWRSPIWSPYCNYFLVQNCKVRFTCYLVKYIFLLKWGILTSTWLQLVSSVSIL